MSRRGVRGRRRDADARAASSRVSAKSDSMMPFLLVLS
jgi:hypothetical protein